MEKETPHGYDNSSHYRRYCAFAGRRRLLWTGTLVVNTCAMAE
jgi:hypothetical protein